MRTICTTRPFWLETLSVRLAAAQDEEQLWRYKYETIAQHTDVLEAECEALKHDIDGHLNVISSTLERTRCAERRRCRRGKPKYPSFEADLERERDELAAASQSHQQALAELRATFDRERETLAADSSGRGPAKSSSSCGLRSEQRARRIHSSTAGGTVEGVNDCPQLRLGFAGERHDLAARLKVSGDELAALRVVSERERDALMAKVAALEAKRAEIRSAFDRIADLKNQANESQDGAGPFRCPDRKRSAARSNPAQPGGRNPAVGEADVVVPRATLRQARSQFEYLAHEFTGAGDVASQVMCELGAFTMDLALGLRPQGGSAAGRRCRAEHPRLARLGCSGQRRDELSSAALTRQPAAFTSAISSSP